MKTILFLTTLFLFVLVAHGQVMSVDNMFDIARLTPTKFDNQLARKGFGFSGKDTRSDTLLRVYDYRRTKYFKDIDTITRSLIRADVKEDALITYQTASVAEYRNLKAQIKKAGFYCNHPDIDDTLSSLYFQTKDLSVRTFVKTEDSLTTYCLQFHKKIFPNKQDIYYVDDLLVFNSHEYLVYYFGEKNVKKDIYFLSGDKVAKCSVLFVNTDRQVVFIWGDEENRCLISSLLVGGQLNLQSSLETGKYVAENNWILKSGVRPGMSLIQLRILHENDFSFYGGKSANSGQVIPGEGGKINFKKEEVVLGCLNCNDEKIRAVREVDADESIRDGRIMFVLSVVLTPSLN